MASFKEIFSYMDKKYGTSTNDINYRSSDEELNLPNPVPNLPALPTFISTPVVYENLSFSYCKVNKSLFP